MVSHLASFGTRTRIFRLAWNESDDDYIADRERYVQRCTDMYRYEMNYERERIH